MITIFKSNKGIPARFSCLAILGLAFFLTNLIFLIQLCSASWVEAGPKNIRVLYVGNSLTTANDLPGLVADLAQSGGYQIEYQVYAPGGKRLMQHASDKRLLELIKSQKWNYVVLQEQSQYPGFSVKQVRKDVLAYARVLSDAVKNANPRSKVVFYQTMARQNGDPDNIKVSPELGSYAGMQKRINRTYEVMAKENKGLLAPVGVVWQKVRQKKPGLKLYSDNIHPNLAGSYLAACVFYTTFFSKSPVGLPYPGRVDSAQARYFQMVVRDTVLR